MEQRTVSTVNGQYHNIYESYGVSREFQQYFSFIDAVNTYEFLTIENIKSK